MAKAETKEAYARANTRKPKTIVKCGLKHVTSLIERKMAKLVIIAHDVEPLELVIWLPVLCRKKGVPYLIIKGKSRLGKIVHKKTATCLAITDVDPKDAKELSNFIQKGDDNFNSRLTEAMRTDGGGIMGFKHNAKKAKEEKRIQKEKKVKEKD